MSDLFNIPETLSPRLAWLKRHNIETMVFPHLIKNPWCATVGSFGEQVINDQQADGKTEDEAITNLAKLLNIPLWNEEGFK